MPGDHRGHSPKQEEHGLTVQAEMRNKHINVCLYVNLPYVKAKKFDGRWCYCFSRYAGRRMAGGYENVIGMVDREGFSYLSGEPCAMKQKGSFSSNTLRPKLWAMAIQPPQTGRIAQPRHPLHPERYLRAASES